MTFNKCHHVKENDMAYYSGSITFCFGIQGQQNKPSPLHRVNIQTINKYSSYCTYIYIIYYTCYVEQNQQPQVDVQIRFNKQLFFFLFIPHPNKLGTKIFMNFS